jgi:hypothetical protein
METMDHGQEKEVEMRYKPSTRPVAVWTGHRFGYHITPGHTIHVLLSSRSYITVFEGHFEITASLIMHAVNYEYS